MLETEHVLAAIVTYNPSLPLLGENISSLLPQVSKLVIFDNGSGNVADMRSLLKQYPKVELLAARDNLGLPVQYNRAMCMARDRGCEWLLTMDQDTVVPENLVETYLSYGKNEAVGIISPVIWNACVDSRREAEERRGTCAGSTETLRCISSAALHRVSALWRAGGFDEALFIDYVDDDCCRRIRRLGYSILRVNSLLVRHCWGNSVRRKVLGMDLVCPNYPAVRYYYIFRNRIYYEKKYGSSPLKVLAFVLYKGARLLLEPEPWEKCRMAVRGVRDGLRGQMGKYGERTR